MSPSKPARPLAHRLREAAPIPFRAFMAAALYDPDDGYYSRHIRSVGRRGDFSTAATLDPALPQAVAAWLTEGWRQRLAPRGHVIEIGAGDGSMAEGVARALPLLTRRKLRYQIVEASPPLAAVQSERLARFGKRFAWHDAVPSALAALGGGSLIFSNELVDAFPATLLRWDSTDEHWDEPDLHAAPDGWSLGPGTTYTPPPGSSIAAAKWRRSPTSEPNRERPTAHPRPQPADGTLIERHDSYFEWLAAWLPAWSRGEMLTIDYGDTFPELYHRRPRGTLRAYFAQQRLGSLAEVLARPGRQDITCDVDFTELATRAAVLGLESDALATQREFITSALGRAVHSPAADPHGAGVAFKTLVQRRSQT